jgi:exopolysaccharide biosynthesis polyprenyl glycosylphosphotransferase
VRWTRIALAVDATMLVAATVLERLATALGGSTAAPLGWLLPLPLLTLGLLAGRGLYRWRLQPHMFDDLRAIAGATTIAAMAVVTARVLGGGDSGDGWQIAHQWLFSLVYLVAGRAGLAFALSRVHRRGEAAVPTLILGAGRIGRLTARRLRERPDLGLRPVAYLDDEPLPSASPLDDLPVLQETWSIDELKRDHDIGQVLVAFSAAPADVQLGLVRQSHQAGIPVAFVPRLYESVPRDVEVEHVGALPLVSVRPSDPRGWQFRVKYGFDRVAAALGLVLVAPVLLAAAVAVRVSLGRPILFRQERVGRDGRTFEMLKLRTMRGGGEDAAGQLPEDTGPGGVEGDDRRTAVGRFLRRFSVDELPQLVNVLRGEMSLVGPRPERPEFVREFQRNVYRYGDRHRVKSGITGWAQIAGLRGKTSLRDRVEWDNWYIENFSLWLDAKILLLTAAAVWRAKGTE